MSKCNATLTTCTVIGDVVDRSEPHLNLWTCIPDGTAVVRDGDRLLRLERHTLTCERDPQSKACQQGTGHRNGRVMWTDDTPGATPHMPPADGCDGTDCRIPAAHTPPADLQTGLNDGLDLEQPPADVCDECGGKKEVYHGWDDLTNTEDWRPCPSCGGTGDVPAVVEARHGDQQARAGWGAVTDAQVEEALAAWTRNLRGNTAFDVMRAALEAARHAEENTDG